MQKSIDYIDLNEAPIRGQTAQELLEAHFQDLKLAEPEEIEGVGQAVTLTAEYLHDCGRTLAWETFDPAGFFPRIAFMPEQEQERYAQYLMAFYIWLASRERTPAAAALDVLRDLAAQFPEAGQLELLLLVSTPLLEHLCSKASCGDMN